LFYGPDASVELIKTGGKLYQSVSTIAGPQPWEVVPASRQGSFGAFLDLGGISDDMLGAGGTLREGETITVAGRPAIALHDAESVLYVATTGTPLSTAGRGQRVAGFRSRLPRLRLAGHRDAAEGLAPGPPDLELAGEKRR
jgi:hypothetical protein